MLDFDVFNECVTNQQTDRPTDTPYYRDARTQLKKLIALELRCEIMEKIRKY